MIHAVLRRIHLSTVDTGDRCETRLSRVITDYHKQRSISTGEMYPMIGYMY